MQLPRKKCPNCGGHNIYGSESTGKVKYECKNCGYVIQMPLVKIWKEEPSDTAIDKINSKFIQESKRKGENG